MPSARVVKHGDEHRRHPVQAGGTFGGAGLERRLRVERLGRVDHAGTVIGGGQIAHHHPEAVIQRDGDADPIRLGVAQQRGDEIRIVEDVVMGERRALGKARGAAGVLDVDRVIEVELVHPGPELVVSRRALRQRLPVIGTEEDGTLQRGQVGADRLDHRDEVRSLQLGGGKQPPAARLPQRVLELVGAVCRVDVDQDQAQLGGGVLDQCPLAPIRRPHPDPIALVQARRQHPGREPVDRPVELRIRVPDPLVAGHERLGVRDPSDGALQVVPDRLAEQRLCVGAVRVGEHAPMLLACLVVGRRTSPRPNESSSPFRAL